MLENANYNIKYFNKKRYTKNKQNLKNNLKTNNSLNENSNLINEENESNTNAKFNSKSKNSKNIDFNTILLSEVINSKAGLINVGNSCYINSSVHILLHSKIFIDKFIKSFSKLEKNNKIISSFYGICNNIFHINSNNEINKFIDIIDFMNFFGKKYSNYTGYKQNDVMEFIRILLNEFNIEFNNIKNNNTYKEFIPDTSKSKEI